MRAQLALLALVGALTAALWLAALLTSSPPPPMAFFLLGEPTAVVGEPWAARFGAVQERGVGLSSMEGRLELSTGASADLAPGFARLSVPSVGRTSGALVACLDGGAPCARARFDLEGVAARAPSRARFSWLGPEPPVTTLASVARRTAVALQAPLEIDAAAASFEVTLERAQGPLLLDVVVDGVVRDVVRAEGPRVGLETPRGLAAGSILVVHAGGPWPQELGAWATLRVADPSEPLGAFAARLAREGGAPADLAVPADEAATRALLSRLKPAVLRAGRLPLEVVVEERAVPWPSLYAGAALLLVALVAVAGRSRKIPALPLALGVGTVAALCVALYIVLHVVGGGG